MIIRKPRNCFLISGLSGWTRYTSDWLGKLRHSYAVACLDQMHVGLPRQASPFVRCRLSGPDARRTASASFAIRTLLLVWTRCTSDCLGKLRHSYAVACLDQIHVGLPRQASPFLRCCLSGPDTRRTASASFVIRTLLLVSPDKLDIKRH